MTETGLIAGWVAPGARVLDLGCGDGTLLRHLWQTRQAPGYGVEIDDAQVLEEVEDPLLLQKTRHEVQVRLPVLNAILHRRIARLQTEVEPVRRQVRSGKMTRRDYNFEKPTLELKKEEQAKVHEKLEVYD